MTLRPPGFRGAAFTVAADGDQRDDVAARRTVSTSLGIPGEWAMVSQVHGNRVVEARGPGHHGDADAIFTTTPSLPLAVFTADCLGVVLEADEAVGVAHAGWRGLVSGVVAALRHAMDDAGVPPRRAAIGPGAAPCCYEVSDEVAERFPDEAVTTTSWGTISVDLSAAAGEALAGLDVWQAESCTVHELGLFSHRRLGSTERMAALGWLW